MLCRVFLIAVALFSGLLLAGDAAAQKIEYDFVKEADFSKFKTYRWKRAETRYPDAAIDQMVVSAIDSQLASKGLTKTEDDKADVYVIYQLAVQQDMAVSSFNRDLGWSTQMGSDSFRGPTTNSTQIIRVGWMILDIFDVNQKKLVWRANVTKTLSDTTDPKKREKNLQKVMTKVFKNYPPKS